MRRPVFVSKEAEDAYDEALTLRRSASKNKMKQNITAYGKSRGEIVNMMEEAGVDFKKFEGAMKLRNLFEIFITSHSAEELLEIQMLDRLIRGLDMEAKGIMMKRIQRGKELNYKDLRLADVLRKFLATSHKLKYGDKKLNVHASYDDIRKQMFADEVINVTPNERSNL